MNKPYDITERLRTPEEMAEYLSACIETAGEDQGFIRKVVEDVVTAAQKLAGHQSKQIAQGTPMSKPNLPELPAPFEPEWPDLHAHALGCGVEDRGIVCRYEAAEYGFQDGVDKAAQSVPEDIYTGEQMTAYAEEAVRQALADPVLISVLDQMWEWATGEGRPPKWQDIDNARRILQVAANIPETRDG